MYEQQNMAEFIKKEESQRKSAYKTRFGGSRGAVTVPLNNGCHFQLVLNNNTSPFGSPGLNQPSMPINDMCLKRLPIGSTSNKPRNRTRNNAQKLRDTGSARKKLLEHVGSGVHAIPESKLPFWVLTGLAINCLEGKHGTVREIYEFIEHYFPYHEYVKVNWKNSVRHCLTYSRFFAKFDKGSTTPIHSSHWWTFADGTEHAFWEQVDMITRRFNNPADCGMAYPEEWSRMTGGRAMSWLDSPKVNEDKYVCEAKPLPYSPARQRRSQDAKPLPYSPANYSEKEKYLVRREMLQKPPHGEGFEEKPAIHQLPPFNVEPWLVPGSPVFSSLENSPQSPLTSFTFAVPVYSGFSHAVTAFPRFSSDAWSAPFSQFSPYL